MRPAWLLSWGIVFAVGAVAGVSLIAAPQALPVEQRTEQMINRQRALRRIPGLSVGVVRNGELVAPQAR